MNLFRKDFLFPTGQAAKIGFDWMGCTGSGNRNFGVQINILYSV